MTQISSKADWIKMSREDFLNKFINQGSYKETFQEAACKKIVEYNALKHIKENVTQELLKMTSAVLIQGEKVPKGSKYIAGDDLL